MFLKVGYRLYKYWSGKREMGKGVFPPAVARLLSEYICCAEIGSDTDIAPEQFGAREQAEARFTKP